LRVSQTISRGGPRSQIAIPAQGMIEFRDALTDLLEEFGTEDGGFRGELPEGRHIRVDNKIFYFDIGQNNRGVFMRVSEVSDGRLLDLLVVKILFSYQSPGPMFTLDQTHCVHCTRSILHYSIILNALLLFLYLHSFLTAVTAHPTFI